ncbi:MAG: 30S ribosomal protein S17 [Sterolibacterium sp.]
MNQTVEKVHRTLTGRVVSDKSQKTVTVAVERHVKHPVIGKMILRTKKYHAHVEDQAKTGDMVQIEECAPISKTKAWRVSQILKKNS